VKRYYAKNSDSPFTYHLCSRAPEFIKAKQDAQLLQRDRAAVCVIVFAKSRTMELGDNDLRTL